MVTQPENNYLRPVALLQSGAIFGDLEAFNRVERR